MLTVTNLNVKVDNKSILDNINISFGPGIHIVMGPNGVGKSSLAHALMGNPNYKVTGSADLAGTELLDLATYERAKAGLFLSFQAPTPIAGLSNFQLIKQCKKEEMLDIKSLTDGLKDFRTAASRFKLDKEWDRKQLNVEASGGEKKKNEVIQMLLLSPKVAILDEPDSGLDVDAIKTLAEMIKEYVDGDSERCVIVITHYEKLINDLDPNTVSIISKRGVVTSPGRTLADTVFESGFSQYE
jgi:Fe-S cluster assembly ATP-binding protein